MAAKQLPDQATLRQLLDYCPETGSLVWKPRGPEWFAHTANPKRIAASWNTRCAGKPALSSLDDGYGIGHLLGQKVLAHRAIWKLVYGVDPDEIDHINHDRSDNRLANLRSVTSAVNRQNFSKRKDNKSGRTGISWVERDKRWSASIRGERLGWFRTLDEAIAAREEAEAKSPLHENHGS